MRTIIILVLVYLAYRLVRDYVRRAKEEKPPAGQDTATVEKGEATALDPVCRSYVPVDSALRVRKGGEVHYFCSDECRQKFIASLKE